MTLFLPSKKKKCAHKNKDVEWSVYVSNELSYKPTKLMITIQQIYATLDYFNSLLFIGICQWY